MAEREHENYLDCKDALRLIPQNHRNRRDWAMKQMMWHKDKREAHLCAISQTLSSIALSSCDKPRATSGKSTGVPVRGEDNISLLFESHISRLRYYYLVARISLSDGDILVARKYFEEAIALLQSSPASETLFVQKEKYFLHHLHLDPVLPDILQLQRRLKDVESSEASETIKRMFSTAQNSQTG